MNQTYQTNNDPMTKLCNIPVCISIVNNNEGKHNWAVDKTDTEIKYNSLLSIFKENN